MKAPWIGVGLLAVAVCRFAEALPVVEHDFLSAGMPAGQVATLEYVARLKIWIVAIDGRPVQMERATNRGTAIRNVFKVGPGAHRIVFKDDLGYRLHPDAVEFVAEAGGRYEIRHELGEQKENVGGGAALYFHYYAPVVDDVKGKQSTRIAGRAAPAFEAKVDAEKNNLLYEDVALPTERTARLYVPRKQRDVYFAEISGRAGGVQVLYQMDDPYAWDFRLLPGDYVLVLTLEHNLDVVSSSVVRVPLKAEAGHTYRVTRAVESAERNFGADTTGGRWDAAVEDVTGKGPPDD